MALHVDIPESDWMKMTIKEQTRMLYLASQDRNDHGCDWAQKKFKKMMFVIIGVILLSSGGVMATNGNSNIVISLLEKIIRLF